MVTELVVELVDATPAQLVAEMLLALVAETAMAIERSSEPVETRLKLRSILVEFVLPHTAPAR